VAVKTLWLQQFGYYNSLLGESTAHFFFFPSSSPPFLLFIFFFFLFLFLLLLVLLAAGGNPAYRNSAFEAISNCNLFLDPPFIFRGLLVEKRERPLLAKGGSMGEKWPVKFYQTIRLARKS
jgi:hypothetical protein